ncbi:MAG: hypothetical protein H0U74_07335 [Bradymonadaceae bacterium]|nr:hypothetical protein [Lujinxingiaceae bacterium]
MKRPSWIALGVLVALGVLFFGIRPKPVTTVDSPRLFVNDDVALSRIEFTGAGAQGARTVLEKRDGIWWVAEPVEAPVNKRVAAQIEAQLFHGIYADDLAVAANRAEHFEVSDDRAVMLAVFTQRADQPALELLVGREITVEQTGARRTYVRRPGKPTIFRAQAAIGELVRLSVDALQERPVADEVHELEVPDELEELEEQPEDQPTP